MHHLNLKREGKIGLLLLKLDKSKAYDRIEWHFLESMMFQLGFVRVWVGKIMQCITIVSFSILINGESTCMIRPSRGMRQGNPLLLYLFLLCTVNLIIMLLKAHSRGKILGIRICRNVLMINHLLFIDDSILFYRAPIEENRNIQSLY